MKGQGSGRRNPTESMQMDKIGTSRGYFRVISVIGVLWKALKKDHIVLWGKKINETE